jgi:putative tricarboxylic transport membrane protein
VKSVKKSLMERLKGTVLSGILVVAAIYLFNLATKFEYSQRGEQLGPGFWPKLMLGIIIILTLADIVLALRKGGKPAAEVSSAENNEVLGVGEGLQDEEQKRYPKLLIMGGLMTVAYVYLIGIIGFALATFLYLVGFTYVGRFRRHVMIWVSGLVGTVFFVFLFIKVVYVSLPTGIPPFEGLTLMIYSLLGIK